MLGYKKDGITNSSNNLVCSICSDLVDLSDLYKDEDNNIWDTCYLCGLANDVSKYNTD